MTLIYTHQILQAMAYILDPKLYSPKYQNFTKMWHFCFLQKWPEQVLHPILISISILFHKIDILRLSNKQNSVNYVISGGQATVWKHASIAIYLKMAAILDLDNFWRRQLKMDKFTEFSIKNDLYMEGIIYKLSRLNR